MLSGLIQYQSIEQSLSMVNMVNRLGRYESEAEEMTKVGQNELQVTGAELRILTVNSR